MFRHGTKNSIAKMQNAQDKIEDALSGWPRSLEKVDPLTYHHIRKDIKTKIDQHFDKDHPMLTIEAVMSILEDMTLSQLAKLEEEEYQKQINSGKEN